MGQPVSHTMCCSVRDKETLGGRPALLTSHSPVFNVEEVPMDLCRPSFLAFAPLWPSSGGPPPKRRLAMANESQVHVYRMEDLEDPCGPSVVGGGSAMNLWLEHKLELPAGRFVSAMIFGERGDEGGSRRFASTLVLATACVEGVAGGPVIRIWRCDAATAEAAGKAAAAAGNGSHMETLSWQWDQGYLASLDTHVTTVRCLGLSTAYLVSGDEAGWCRLWDMPKQYACHRQEQVAGESVGGLADMITDRHFAYTIGKEELTVKVWSLPELRLALTIPAEPAIQGLLEKQPIAVVPVTFATAGDAAARAVVPTARLTGLRRPISRWSGAQPSKNVREGGPPRGLLFVAGEIDVARDMAHTGSSFLMVWVLKAEPVCQSIELANDSSIVAVSYGPYDNGPLITADARGVFWVWEFAPRLVPTQQVDPGCFDLQSPAVAVDPGTRALYAIMGSNDQRLFVMRQQHAANPRLTPEGS